MNRFKALHMAALAAVVLLGIPSDSLHAATISGEGQPLESSAEDEKPDVEPTTTPVTSDVRRDASTVSISAGGQTLDSASERKDVINDALSRLRGSTVKTEPEIRPNSASSPAPAGPTGDVLKSGNESGPVLDLNPADPVGNPVPRAVPNATPVVAAQPQISPTSAPLPFPAVAANQLDPSVAAELHRLLQAGAKAYAEKDDAAAMENFEKADKLVPDQAGIYVCKAMVLARQGDFTAASKYFEQAVKIKPNDANIRFMRATLWMDRKEYAKAREELLSSLDLMPADEGLRFNIVLTYLMEKNQAGAQEELDKFKQPSDTPAYYFASSAVAYSSGEINKSVDWISSGVRIFGERRCTIFYTSLQKAGLLKILTEPRVPAMTLSGAAK